MKSLTNSCARGYTSRMPRRPAMFRPPTLGQARRVLDRERRTLAHRRLLHTARWLRFRLAVLHDRPVCQRCGVAPSRDVHHVRGLAAHLQDLCDPEKVESLCHPCHSRLTIRGQ